MDTQLVLVWESVHAIAGQISWSDGYLRCTHILRVKLLLRARLQAKIWVALRCLTFGGVLLLEEVRNRSLLVLGSLLRPQGLCWLN